MRGMQPAAVVHSGLRHRGDHFIYEERIAAEPIIPLSLFRNRSFLLCSLIGFVIGMSLFGSVTSAAYLPGGERGDANRGRYS